MLHDFVVRDDRDIDQWKGFRVESPRQLWVVKFVQPVQ